MSALPFSPSASVTLTLSTAQVNQNLTGTGRRIRFVNAGAGNAYVAFYELGQAAPVLAVGTAMLIPGGAIEVFSVASDTTQIATLGDATGTSLNITRGSGE